MIDDQLLMDDDQLLMDDDQSFQIASTPPVRGSRLLRIRSWRHLRPVFIADAAKSGLRAAN
jgi:hypothetical protein